MSLIHTKAFLLLSSIRNRQISYSKTNGAKALLFVVMRRKLLRWSYTGKRRSLCIVFERRLAMPGIENTVAVPALFFQSLNRHDRHGTASVK